jgi:hypothetical protein
MFKIYYKLTSLLSYVQYLDYIKIQYNTIHYISLWWEVERYLLYSCFPFSLIFNSNQSFCFKFKFYSSCSTFFRQQKDNTYFLKYVLCKLALMFMYCKLFIDFFHLICLMPYFCEWDVYFTQHNFFFLMSHSKETWYNVIVFMNLYCQN